MKKTILLIIICIFLSDIALAYTEIDGGYLSLASGDIDNVAIDIDTDDNIYSYEISITYDASIISLDSYELGDFLDKDGTSLQDDVREDKGEIIISRVRMNEDTGVSGEGKLVTLFFEGLEDGVSDIGIEFEALGPDLRIIEDVNIENGTAIVKDYTHFDIYPEEIDARKGTEFTIDINGSTTENIYGYQFDIVFDSSVLEAVEVTHGDFLVPDGSTLWTDTKINNSAGTVEIAASRVDTEIGIDGEGNMVEVKFLAKEAGESNIDFEDIKVSDEDINPIIPGTEGCFVNVFTLEGDTNNDCEVDIFDMAFVGMHFYLEEGDESWDERADVYEDGIIDIFDLSKVGINFGNIC